MKTKPKTTETKNSQSLKQVGFEKEDVRKVCFKKHANIHKGTDNKKRKTEEPPPPKKRFPKGVDGQKTKKT